MGPLKFVFSLGSSANEVLCPGCSDESDQTGDISRLGPCAFLVSKWISLLYFEPLPIPREKVPVRGNHLVNSSSSGLREESLAIDSLRPWQIHTYMDLRGSQMAVVGTVNSNGLGSGSCF